MTRDGLRVLLQPLPDDAILGLTVYGEARGEPIEGQIAVANVIRNRVQDGKQRYGKTYRDVCLKKLQFSCWNPSETDRNFLHLIQLAERLLAKADTPEFEECAWVALGIAQGALTDNTKRANHYHVAALHPRPEWARNYVPVKQVAAHVFYVL